MPEAASNPAPSTPAPNRGRCDYLAGLIVGDRHHAAAGSAEQPMVRLILAARQECLADPATGRFCALPSMQPAASRVWRCFRDSPLGGHCRTWADRLTWSSHSRRRPRAEIRDAHAHNCAPRLGIWFLRPDAVHPPVVSRYARIVTHEDAVVRLERCVGPGIVLERPPAI